MHLNRTVSAVVSCSAVLKTGIVFSTLHYRFWTIPANVVWRQELCSNYVILIPTATKHAAAFVEIQPCNWNRKHIVLWRSVRKRPFHRSYRAKPVRLVWLKLFVVKLYSHPGKSDFRNPWIVGFAYFSTSTVSAARFVVCDVNRLLARHIMPSRQSWDYPVDEIEDFEEAISSNQAVPSSSPPYFVVARISRNSITARWIAGWIAVSSVANGIFQDRTEPANEKSQRLVFTPLSRKDMEDVVQLQRIMGKQSINSTGSTSSCSSGSSNESSRGLLTLSHLPAAEIPPPPPSIPPQPNQTVQARSPPINRTALSRAKDRSRFRSRSKSPQTGQGQTPVGNNQRTLVIDGNIRYEDVVKSPANAQRTAPTKTQGRQCSRESELPHPDQNSRPVFVAIFVSARIHTCGRGITNGQPIAAWIELLNQTIGSHVFPGLRSFLRCSSLFTPFDVCGVWPGPLEASVKNAFRDCWFIVRWHCSKPFVGLKSNYLRQNPGSDDEQVEPMAGGPISTSMTSSTCRGLEFMVSDQIWFMGRCWYRCKRNAI